MSATLDANRIPAEPIIEVVRSYLNDNGIRRSDGVFEPFSLYVLAERADVHGDTLEKIMAGRNRTIDFDLADRLLCAMNLYDLWHTELNDLYTAIPIPDDGYRRKVDPPSGIKRCERKGCCNTFSTRSKHGGKPQRFCSEVCRQADYDRRRREKMGLRPRYSNPNDTCLHGHDWTPENIYYHGNPPRRRCRACNLARQSEYRLRQKERQQREG